MKRKLWLLFLTVILGVQMLGCSLFSEPKDEIRNIRIGVSISDEFDPFITEIVNQMILACKEKEKETGVIILVDVHSSGVSQLTQNEQVDEFADEGYDIACINLVDRTDANTIIDKAKSANMPVIFFNRELVEEDLERWDKLFYVGADAEEAGVMQGKIVVDACKERFDEIDLNKDGKLQYIMLEGEAGHQDALFRTQKSVETIVENGIEVEKLDSVIANWNREQAITKTNSLIEKYRDRIELILANNDTMALGAIDVYEKSNMKLPLIVGVNGEEEALEKILSKKIEGTVYNDAIGQGRAMAELSFAVAEGLEIPDEIPMTDHKYVLLPYRIINFYNARQYQK